MNPVSLLPHLVFLGHAGRKHKHVPQLHQTEKTDQNFGFENVTSLPECLSQCVNEKLGCLCRCKFLCQMHVVQLFTAPCSTNTQQASCRRCGNNYKINGRGEQLLWPVNLKKLPVTLQTVVGVKIWMDCNFIHWYFERESSLAVTYTSHHSIIIPLFILFAPLNMYLQQQLSPFVSNCRYFNQRSEHQKVLLLSPTPVTTPL